MLVLHRSNQSSPPIILQGSYAMDAGGPRRRRNNEAHHHGVADDKAKAGAAPNTIQARIWREVFCNPLALLMALLLAGLNLFTIWAFIRQVGLSRESLPSILLFLFFLMPILVGMSMLPFGMYLDEQHHRASAAAMTPPASGSGTKAKDE
ncbi:hypothetical protein U9M48_004702 [Paspalum notatum var. saurae]|uniref:Uncharacterized protein n=1 Tax=Paspalum notatum var. saurae TaxID=547442 RepID=A0AAQ3SLH3_PASNO